MLSKVVCKVVRTSEASEVRERRVSGASHPETRFGFERAKRVSTVVRTSEASEVRERRVRGASHPGE